ncbi:hypothetical protein A1355_13075 [Methylomonas koyamae]|uniref:Uncharacterized protein n=1 Tax=Methylomonas koyamae TaxID=702114 RepID=A0A177N900_9GAMM|nr:hypothetical protein A1355_13075 [Methylomonas koyamae]
MKNRRAKYGHTRIRRGFSVAAKAAARPIFFFMLRGDEAFHDGYLDAINRKFLSGFDAEIRLMD